MFQPASLLFLATSALLASATSYHGYSDTCWSIKQVGEMTPKGIYVQATCPWLTSLCPKVTHQTTKLNLAYCVVNVDGQLTAEISNEFNHFALTCSGCFVKGTTLGCDACLKDDGTYMSSSIDTNSFVGDNHGFITCYADLPPILDKCPEPTD